MNVLLNVFIRGLKNVDGLKIKTSTGLLIVDFNGNESKLDFYKTIYKYQQSDVDYYDVGSNTIFLKQVELKD